MLSRSSQFRSQCGCTWLLAIVATLLVSGCEEQAQFLRKFDWMEQGTWIKVDTHVHTTFSDGAHSVSTVAAKAVEHGCDAMAVTDHADHNLDAATPEYEDAINVARRQHEGLIILSGLEWNVPPFGGDDHATVLVAPRPDEFLQLADFKSRFDDLGRETHEAQLASEALKWLHESSGAHTPVVISNHPSRKLEAVGDVVSRLESLRSVNDVVVGFSGAPGHQKAVEVGAYSNVLKTVDRWDPAVEPDGPWDQLLRQGVDVWAARAPSDFHKEHDDYWPGEFSETWLYAPERSAQGVLKAFRAGSFFAAHGHIVRELQLTVEAAGLPRPAYAGESIEVAAGSQVTLRLTGNVPEFDWTGNANQVDAVEFIIVTDDGVEIHEHDIGSGDKLHVSRSLQVPAAGIVVRARGRRVVADGPDLMFYANPVRIEVAPPHSLSAVIPLSRDAFRSKSLRCSLGTLLVVLVVVSAVRAQWRNDSPTMSAMESIDNPQQSAPYRAHFVLAAVGFTALAIYGSLVPLNYRPTDWNAAVERFQNIPYLQLNLSHRADWVANILLFIPISFFWMGAATVDNTSRWPQFVLFPLVVVACAGLSIVLEFTQIWFPPRTVSQNDIVAESLGGVVGSVLWIAVGQRATQWMRRCTNSLHTSSQFDWLLQAYLVGFIIYSVLPLDLTIHPVELYRKYREGKIALVPWNNELSPLAIWESLADVLTFIPVGMLAARASMLPGAGTGKFRSAVVLGALVVLGIECAQLLVYSRFTESVDLVTGTLGVILGVEWVRRWNRIAPSKHASGTSQSLKWTAVALAYSALLGIIFWWPFRLEPDSEIVRNRFGSFLRVPFAAMYRGSEMNAATQIARKMVLFALLGAVLARLVLAVSVSKRTRTMIVALAVVWGALLGTTIELGQSCLADHTVDVTDTLLYTMGAVFGLAISLRLYQGQDTVAEAHSALGTNYSETTKRHVRPWLGVAAVLALVATAGAFVAVQRGSIFGHRPMPLVGDSGASGSSNPAHRLGTLFTPAPSSPHIAPEAAMIEIPDFPGAHAIWGATGRDHRGHIWFGVSAAGVETPSAHLYEYVPDAGHVIDRGDVVTELKRIGLYRRDEGQMKIHTKIVQADDGFLYFASMDEEGEIEDGSRLPTWGSHLWRLDITENRWEHLFRAPEGLIALSCVGRWVYLLGYFNHVLYQYDSHTGNMRETEVGSVGGHISRNLVSDQRGHVYVPRLRDQIGSPQDSISERYPGSLVEFDTELREVGETPLEFYGGGPTSSSHGMIGFTHLADNTIVFATHRGHLYQIVPGTNGPAHVEPLGWYHPDGEAYTPSVFSFGGQRYLVGIGRRNRQPYEWIVYDLQTRESTTAALPLDACVPATAKDFLLYGSLTRDDEGRFYIAGRYSLHSRRRPILVQLKVIQGTSLALR